MPIKGGSQYNSQRKERRKELKMFIKKADEGYVVEMSAAEHKKAMTYGTEEYRALREIRNDYPGIEAKVVSGKKTVKVKDKLNMNTIKAYVKANGNDEQKADFEAIAFHHITENGIYIEAKSFFEIKKWFYAEFPEYKKAVDDHQALIDGIFKEVDNKIDKAKKKAEAEKRAELEAEVAEFRKVA